jgi:hypothetical protein
VIAQLAGAANPAHPASEKLSFVEPADAAYFLEGDAT